MKPETPWNQYHETYWDDPAACYAIRFSSCPRCAFLLVSCACFREGAEADRKSRADRWAFNRAEALAGF